MVADMLRFGYPLPDIRETASPSVVVTLVADAVDEGWMAWLEKIDDSRSASNLRWLMSLHLLTQQGWFDVRTLSAFLQVSDAECEAVIHDLHDATIAGQPLIG